ncbi:hypothetical protein [Bdellovibrio sp. HCB2-146]|uniref:hypothetical protein n=1 Tax=Bdellovibrio sp. HCB2-146 TaxID=3394362 RepID=UPI0039BD5A41
MLSRIGFVFLLLLFSFKSYAGKDLILFIYASQNSPHINESDYLARSYSMKEFESLVQQANANIAPQERPEVVRLELGNLSELGSRLAELSQQDASYQGSQVRMIFIGGHGNRRQFFLHNQMSYTGTQMAQILTSENVHPHLGKNVGIYFSACNCGESLKPDTFQVEFMNQFKERNEKLQSEKQTQSLVSIAHRYMSLAESFKARSFGFDMILYKAKVLKVVEDVNMYIFKKLGREALHNSSLVVAGAFVGLTAILHFVVNPEITSDSIRNLLLSMQGIGFGMAFLHGNLKLMAYKWTQKLEYRNSPTVPITAKDIAAGNAVFEVIRVPLFTCEGVF